MRAGLLAAGCVLAAGLGLSAQARPAALTIDYVDTEGGQSTGLEDLWQRNPPPTAPGGGRAGGAAAAAAHTPAYIIKVTAQQDGSFTVTNTRNTVSKTYRPRQ